MNISHIYPDTKNRYGESDPVPARKNRLFNQHNEWYFLTREYGVFGPYPSMLVAKDELKLFLRRLGIVRQANL